MTNQTFTIGQSVKYNYSDTETRTGEIVDYDAETNRYRVYWHTAKSSNSPNWTGHPNKRTWVKALSLTAA